MTSNKASTSTSNNLELLLQCEGYELFDQLEKLIKIKIPLVIRDILIFHEVDNAGIISRIDENYMTKMESFMKHQLRSDMLPGNKPLSHYLGKFHNNQKKFEFSIGQQTVLATIKDFFNEKSVQDHAQNATIIESIEIDTKPEDERFEHVNLDDELHNLHNYIGSLMISVYNDAKRKTLTAFSWPSRHVALDMANYYKSNGNLDNFNPKLQYVTPTQHNEFLNCIVQSDFKNLAPCLKDALAVSARIDGFDIPKVVKLLKNGKPAKNAPSLAYYECVKSIIGKVLPWKDFLELVSSLVTDGEALNMGKDNGLCARLLREGQLINKNIISIWCVPHRFNLAWKDLCKEIPLVEMIINEATALSSYFHKSGERTHKLNDAAFQNKLPEPLRYLAYFEVRWTQFTFELFNVSLRNWRAAMLYFKNEQEAGLEQRWLLYDRIRLLAFLADVLYLLKTFQKTFEGDTVSILSLQNKKKKLCDRLLECITKPTDKGWEQEVLKNIEEKSDGKYFYGHKLKEYVGRSNRTNTCVYSEASRELIMSTLIKHVITRIDVDIELQNNLKTLAEINTSVSHQSLESCYKLIVPDLDEDTFYIEYKIAADVLNGKVFDSPLETLQELHSLLPDKLFTLKSALARVAAAKPHSADVERLISVYNLIKATDRTSLDPTTLFHYLYVNMNMVPLFEFDPSTAVQYWMQQKNRRPITGKKSKKQEWFKGVFPEAKQRDKSTNTKIVKF